jgi:hypothetical protein
MEATFYGSQPISVEADERNKATLFIIMNGLFDEFCMFVQTYEGNAIEDIVRAMNKDEQSEERA